MTPPTGVETPSLDASGMTQRQVKLSKHVSSALHVLPLIFRASQLTKQQEGVLCSLAEMYTRALFRRKVSPTQEVQSDQTLGSLVAQVHRHLASEPEDVHRWWAGFGGPP